MSSAAVPVPLAGAAALAFDYAMHAEGLRGPVRYRVLDRLSRDAAWLAYADLPPVLSVSVL